MMTALSFNKLMIKSTNAALIAAHSPLRKQQCGLMIENCLVSHTKLASHLPSEKAQCLVVKQMEHKLSGKVIQIKKLPKLSKKF